MLEVLQYITTVIVVRVCHSTNCWLNCCFRMTDVSMDLNSVETWLDLIGDDCQQPTKSATCMCSLSNTYLCNYYCVLRIIIIIVTSIHIGQLYFSLYSVEKYLRLSLLELFECISLVFSFTDIVINSVSTLDMIVTLSFD